MAKYNPQPNSISQAAISVGRIDSQPSIKTALISGQSKLVSIDVVAMRYGLSRSYLYHQVAAKRIPHYKIGSALRFDLIEIESYMSGFKIDPLGHGGVK